MNTIQIRFHDGLKIQEEELNRVAAVALEAIKSALHEDARRFDVVSNVLELAANRLECEKIGITDRG